MAFCGFPKFWKCSPMLFYIRSYKFIKKVKLSTSQQMLSVNPPVKFSNTKAFDISIAESVGLKEKSEELWYEKYVIIFSVGILLVYFCVLREENDIDDILKGDLQEQKNPYITLIDLKTKLKYCEKNNLPTSALKAKIEEMEKNLNPKKSPFRM